MHRRGRTRHRALRGCARFVWSASGSPTTSATSVRSATTAASRSGSRSSRACVENVLRSNLAGRFGHRLLMDVVVPGGVAGDIAWEHAHLMRDEARAYRARDRRVARHL